jgi:hypothetical protein
MGMDALNWISCDLISFLHIILADLPVAMHTYNIQQSLTSLITVEVSLGFPPCTTNDSIVSFGYISYGFRQHSHSWFRAPWDTSCFSLSQS